MLAGISGHQPVEVATWFGLCGHSYQLLYIVLGITLYIVVFQLPLQNSSSLSDPAVHVGQEFLQAVKNGDKDRVASLVDPSIVGALQNNLAPYQSSIRYNPQMVLAETFNLACNNTLMLMSSI
jgi:hypothetical protein